ncbi:MAG: hypothetical protein EB138_00745 [Actinobacteria bacterium]|nr:hypothetical protein [Actinomycetota bacterium]
MAYLSAMIPVSTVSSRPPSIRTTSARNVAGVATAPSVVSNPPLAASEIGIRCLPTTRFCGNRCTICTSFGNEPSLAREQPVSALVPAAAHAPVAVAPTASRAAVCRNSRRVVVDTR